MPRSGRLSKPTAPASLLRFGELGVGFLEERQTCRCSALKDSKIRLKGQAKGIRSRLRRHETMQPRARKEDECRPLGVDKGGGLLAFILHLASKSTNN